jgi:hypothetical protein
MQALYDAKPRTAEAQAVLRNAAPWVTWTRVRQSLPFMPAVLIPHTEIGALAYYLAAAIAERTGSGSPRRERLREELHSALVAKHRELARNFVWFCIGRFPVAPPIDYKSVLCEFGYSDVYAEFFAPEGG